MEKPQFPLAHIALARRLEGTEGNANVAFVESRVRLRPESGAVWCDGGGNTRVKWMLKCAG